MFDQLSSLPPDPILGLMAAYRVDNNPNKIDLGVGVYKDETGTTPVMKAVKAAESRLLSTQTVKRMLDLWAWIRSMNQSQNWYLAQN